MKGPSAAYELAFEERKLFYGYTAGALFPFARISTTSLSHFRALKNLFLDKSCCPATKQRLGGSFAGQAPEVFEANLDPMLRFFHLRNLQPCGWVATDDYSEVEGDSADATATLIIEADWKSITPAKGPAPTAPFKVASWDIECYSPTGEFPVTQRTYENIGKDILAACTDTTSVATSVLDRLYSPTPKYTTKCPLPPRERVEAWLTADRASAAIAAAVAAGDATVLGQVLESILGKRVPLAGDPVIQIGTVLAEQGAASAGAARHVFVYPSCGPVEGAVVHEFKTEAEMIRGWARWMLAEDPDILVGYNTFGFDEKYMWERACELGIQGTDEIQQLNRLAAAGSGELKCEEKFLSSAALGDNFLYIWSTQGRLQVDLYHYVRRTASLPSYKLDSVAKNYMSGSVRGTEVLEGTVRCTVKGNLADIRPGRYIALLDDIGEEILDKLPVLRVDGQDLYVGVSPDTVTDDLHLVTKWAIVKDDVSPQDIFRLHRGSAEDRAIVAAYCVQDCDLVLDLYKKLDVFNTAMSMANVCSVPIGYIMTRGQGVKIESLIFKETYRRGQTIIVLPTPNRSAVEDSYEGAIVLDPSQTGLLGSPVGVADFASLYPSTIISENISHDTIIWGKDYDYKGRLLYYSWGEENKYAGAGLPCTDIEFDILKPDPADTRKNPEKVRVGRRICRYAQDTKGTLPAIIEGLLAARKATRQAAAKEKDPLRCALLDAEQNAYKVTANSLYGQLGSATFKVRLQHLAASVTAYGRKQIMFAKEVIERFYGGGADKRCDVRCEAKTVYGDSVTGDTPVLVDVGGQVQYIEIQELFRGAAAAASPWHGDKDAIEPRDLLAWTERGWTSIRRIIRHHIAASKRLYRIRTGAGYVDVTEDHSLVLSNGTAAKPADVKVGTHLLHSICPLVPVPTVQPLAGTKLREAYDWIATLQAPNALEASATAIISIIELAHPGADTYVYDFETENHHFAVGPGALVVHNTDSLFVQFNPRNPETGEALQGRDARLATIDLTAEAGHLVTQSLKAPHDFEFDKVFDPILLFSKKRYAGKMFENADKPDDFVYKYMGIALKRRDNAPIVKTIYGAAMKKVLDEKDVISAAALVKQGCMDLVEGRVPLTQLTITKSLRAEYANPASVAHKVLAMRMAVRDPGNAPAPGDRIPFVYVKPAPGVLASKTQGDRIETPVYIKEKGLVPDYPYYIEHQLSSPIGQMFALLLEAVPGYSAALLPAGFAEMKPEAAAAVRERIAYQLLFKDALAKAHLLGTKTATLAMFGAAATRTVKSSVCSTRTQATAPAAVAAPAVPAVQPQSQRQQMTITNYFADAAYLAMRKKAAVAAKKTTTATATPQPQGTQGTHATLNI
jgi:DNA polymerase elongation subunit (family B)